MSVCLSICICLYLTLCTLKTPYSMNTFFFCLHFFFHLVRVLLNAHQRQPQQHIMLLVIFFFFSSFKNSVKSMEKHGPMWWTLRLFRKNINVCCTMCAILHKLEMISLCSRHAVCCCFAVVHVAHVVETAAAAAKLQIRIVCCTTLMLMSISPLFLCLSNALTHTHSLAYTITSDVCCLIKRQNVTENKIVQRIQSNTRQFPFVSLLETWNSNTKIWLTKNCGFLCSFQGYSNFVGIYRQRWRQKFTIVDRINSFIKICWTNKMCVEIVAAHSTYTFILKLICVFALKTKWPRCCICFFSYFSFSTRRRRYIFFLLIFFLSFLFCCLRVCVCCFFLVCKRDYTHHTQSGLFCRSSWFTAFSMVWYVFVCVLTLIWRCT